MPCAVALMFGGLWFVRILIAEKPPPSTQIAPPPTRKPSLLVGSGSTNARITMVTPMPLIPSATQTLTISRLERPETLAICDRVWSPGLIPRAASSTSTPVRRVRYMIASVLNQLGSDVLTIVSLRSVMGESLYLNPFKRAADSEGRVL